MKYQLSKLTRMMKDLKSIEVDTAEGAVIHMKDAARQKASDPTEEIAEEMIGRYLQLLFIYCAMIYNEGIGGIVILGVL